MLVGFHDSLSFTSSSSPLDFLGGWKKRKGRGENQQTNQPTTPPASPLSFPENQSFVKSFTSSLKNSRKEKCCFSKSHYSAVSNGPPNWSGRMNCSGQPTQFDIWTGFLCTKDINRYSKSWIPTSYTKLARHRLLCGAYFAMLKSNSPTKMPRSLRGKRWWLH